MPSRARGSWRVCIVFVLLALLASGLNPARAQDGIMSAEAYWALLGETTKALETADEVALASLAERWELTAGILLDDGTLQAVNFAPLAESLRHTERDQEALRRWLAALGTARSEWAQQTDVAGAASAAAQLKETLAAYDFEPKEASLWQRLRNYVVNAVLELLGRMFGQSITSLPLGSILALVLVPSLLAILILILRGVARDFVSNTTLVEGPAGDQLLTADSALSHAQALSREGDYRTAVRYLYLSSLLSLEERGLLRYDRALTNREYLRSAAHVPELASVLGDIIEIFDQVWYGFQPISEESYEAYAARVRALRR